MRLRADIFIVLNYGNIYSLYFRKDYEETNSVIVTKIQFYAIELARNREGHNDEIRKNFKPSKRGSKNKEQQDGFQTNLTKEVEAELQNIVTGNHDLLKK